MPPLFFPDFVGQSFIAPLIELDQFAGIVADQGFGFVKKTGLNVGGNVRVGNKNGFVMSHTHLLLVDKALSIKTQSKDRRRF